MPFYYKDAYTDEVYSALSWEAQGFFVFLASWQWAEGSIPADVEDILDRVPRRKVSATRRVWKEVAPMFPVVAQTDRRQNLTTERHRAAMLGRRRGHVNGAVKTNAKRWGEAKAEQADSESLTDSLSDTPADRLAIQGANRSTGSLAVAVATAVAVAVKDGGGVEMKPPPSFDGVEAIDIVLRVVGEIAPQIEVDDFEISRWLRDIRPDPWWIAAKLIEAEMSLRKGHHPAYLRAILERESSENDASDPLNDPEQCRAFVAFTMSPRHRATVAAAKATCTHPKTEKQERLQGGADDVCVSCGEVISPHFRRNPE